MKKISLVLALVLSVAIVHSQTIKGKVVDDVDRKPLAGATLTLTHVKDSTRIYKGIADSSGAFQFVGLPIDSFFFKLSYIDYEAYTQIVATNDSMPVVNLGTIFIPKKTTEIAGIVLNSKTPPVQQKGDTSQYNASQFKVNPDATTEDLIKKMPGITVGKDGTVTAQGQTVQKVTVDGRDFFGDDATATLRNLPAEIVDKIQVFDRLSDQSQFTGFDDGNSQRSINIVTRSGVTNGQFGRIYAGYGTDSRYAGGGNVSIFKGNRRLSFVGNFNNINQQNFAQQDILGATSSGGGNRGGGGNFGGGGGNFGGGNFGGGNNFNVGQQSGISKTNAFGINFGDKWGKKMDVQASYFFNGSNNTNNQEQNISQQFSKGIKTGLQETSQSSISNSKSTNHRFNMRFTYNIDSNNSILVTPNISFQNTDRYSTSQTNVFFNQDSSNYTNSENRSRNNGYNIRNNILYRHSFAKRGRTFSINLNTGLNKNSSESYPFSYIRYYNESGDFIDDSTLSLFKDNLTDGYSLNANISYTEPIGKKGQLQISYQPSYSKNKADQQTFNYDGSKYSIFIDSLSNKFDNTTITQNGGVTYRLGASRDNQFSAGLNVQSTELNSDRIFPSVSKVSQTFINILPNLMWRKKISPRSSFNIFYRANTRQPSVTQLQDVLDLSNPINVSIGNPELKQSFTQIFTGRYTFTNTQKGQSFFANFSSQLADNYISNATYRFSSTDTVIQNQEIKRGSNLSKPVNLSGYKSLATFLTFSQPVKFIKSNLSLNAGFNYSNIPSLLVNDGVGVKGSTKNYTYNTGVVVASNINEYVDFNLSYDANFSNAKVNSESNKSVNTSAGLQLNLLSKSGWFLQNDVTNLTTSGLGEGYNQSFWLWNAAFGKKLLKKKQAEIKLSVFDLLKQNQSITRTISQINGSIIDSKSQVITQYFMLTFTYSLKSFGTPARSQFGGQRGNFGGQGGQGGGQRGNFGGGQRDF
ncbi:MAG: TonB-dependent receptor [Chitinophagaceae bacterium]